MHKFHHIDTRQLIIDASKGSELLRGVDRDFPKSRIHRLRTVPACLKRDDELSFTMSGVKFRKLCGMSRLLRSAKSFVSYGSARSAFLFALAQYCLQLDVKLELFLLESTPWQASGTDKLYRRLFESFPVTWVKREDWPRIHALLPAGKEVIPEGGVGPDALLGAMSLGLDIVEQMREEDFRHVWIDAGTGLSAQALIYALGELLENPPLVHVVLCAGNEESFAKDLEAYAFRRAPYVCHRPPTARSYGATNQTVWQTIDRYLQMEGVLLDPMYSAKLILAYEEDRTEQSLIIHSGGGLNNFGFV